MGVLPQKLLGLSLEARLLLLLFSTKLFLNQVLESTSDKSQSQTEC